MLSHKNHDQLTALTELISHAVDAEFDLIQIRERDLPARDLLALTDVAVGMALGSSTRILVNDRADIAACAGQECILQRGPSIRAPSGRLSGTNC